MGKEFSHHHRQECLSRQANFLDLEELNQAGQPNEVEPLDQQQRWSMELVAVIDLQGPELSPGQQERQQQQCPCL